MTTPCKACGGPYHPATGHLMKPEWPLCGPCARSWCKWLKGMMSRKWGGQRFYDHALTSIRPQEDDG